MVQLVRPCHKTMTAKIIYTLKLWTVNGSIYILMIPYKYKKMDVNIMESW